MKTIVLWAFLLGAVRCGEYSEMFKCPADPTNIHLKIYRNQTVHWKAQVQQEHTEVEGDVAAWDVGSDQPFTPRCNDSGSVTIVATITVPPQGKAVVRTQIQKCIPEGYRKFSEGHYFKTYPEPVTWLEARDVCEKEGAHLAIINSEAESKFIAAMWTHKHDWAFIGIHDFYEEGNFVTLYNESIRDTGYVKWNAGEPNGGTKENCVAMHRNLLLYDAVCIHTASFFCELEY